MALRSGQELLTTASHTDHDLRWSIMESEQAGTCLACLVEMLEDSTISIIKKRVVLAGFLKLLNKQTGQVIALLSCDSRVTVHVALILLNLMGASEESFVSMAVEAELQLLCHANSDELTSCVLEAISQDCLKSCNYKKSLPLFSLVGKLLHTAPQQATQLLNSFGSFVDYLCAGLCYADPSVQASVSYILVHLYSTDCRPLIPAPLSSQVAHNVLQILGTSQEQEVTLNLLGLLKTMLEDNSLAEIYMNLSQADTGLPVVLKKVLMRRQELLQIAAVQCLGSVLMKDKGLQYAVFFLQADMAEFLFEALETQNEFLVRSILCSLVLFTESDIFFEKCHAVYGIESILRSVNFALKLKNPDILIQGLTLLGNILDRHRGGIRLFSSTTLVNQCLGQIAEGVRHHNHQVSSLATKCFQHLLRGEHMSTPVPYQEFAATIECLATKVMEKDGAMLGRNDSNKSKASILAEKAEMHQKRFYELLMIIEMAFRLVPQHEDDAAASIVSGAVTVQTFKTFLLQTVQHTCIPTFIMLSGEHVEDPAVFVRCFSILSHLFASSPSTMDIWCQRMGVDFIHHTLNIKSRFRHSELKIEASKFLHQVLVSLMTNEGEVISESFREELKLGILELQGSSKDIDCVLTQSSMSGGDGSLVNAQYSTVCLLYMLHLHGERCNGTLRKLHQCIESFISLQPNQNQMPVPVFRYLLFLYALSSFQTKETDKPEVLQHLMAYMENCSNTEDWCSMQPCLLHWIFSDDRIALFCGAKVLDGWLKSEQNIDLPASPNETLLEVALSYHCCLKTLMEMLIQDDGRTVENIYNLLKKVVAKCITLESAESGSIEAWTILGLYLPETLQKLFLDQDNKDKEMNTAAILNLLTVIKWHSLENPLNSLDMKLAFHVNSLFKEKVMKSYVQEAAVMFLNCLLMQSMHQNDNRVCSLLLSNSTLLQYLSSEMTEQKEACYMLTILMYEQDEHNIQIHQAISIDQNALRRKLHAEDSLFKVCSILFWTAYLKLKFNSPLVKMETPPERKKLLTEDKDIGLHIQCKEVRTLYIYLQQSLIQDIELVQESSALCLQELLNFSKNHIKQLYEHTLYQTWTSFLLQVAFYQIDGQSLPKWLLKISHLVLEHEPKLLTMSFCKTILQAFIQQKPEEEMINKELVKLVQKIVERDDLKLDGSILADVHIKLSELLKDGAFQEYLNGTKTDQSSFQNLLMAVNDAVVNSIF